MDIRATKFTVKIFGEGLTEWYYFDKLRSKKIFSFTLDPGFPVKSRSSYKKRLLLIDKELAKPAEERANLIVLITDLDNIVCDSALLREYLSYKAKYETKGVIFIESHPCIELWFLYHFLPHYDKTNYATYDEIKEPLKKYLPGYDKSKSYYTGNTQFRDYIIDSHAHRINATGCAESSQKYPVTDGELSNSTSLHRLVMFLHMMQFCYSMSDILHSIIHTSFAFEPEVLGLEKINIRINGNYLASLKIERDHIVCCTGSKPVMIPIDFYNGKYDLSILFSTLTSAVKSIIADNQL